MGLAPFGANLRGFRGDFEDEDGFRVGPNSVAMSLVLDKVRGELVRAGFEDAVKKGGEGGGGDLDMKAAMALKSHSEAERRRRERINGHLATLRTMVPSADKLDKAALLAEVINHVKKLKSRAMGASKGLSIPSAADEVRVEANGDGMENGHGVFSIKASLCCEDRPEIVSDLKQTVQSLKLKTVRAEVYTLAGRMKNALVMTCDESPSDMDRGLFTANVQQALRSVLDRATSPEFVPRAAYASKRRRISHFESSNSSS